MNLYPITITMHPIRTKMIATVVALISTFSSAKETQIYTASSGFDMSLITNDESFSGLSTSEVFQFESVASKFLHDLVVGDSSKVDPGGILITNLEVKDQWKDSSSASTVSIGAIVSVTYTDSTTISDLSSLLSDVMSSKESNNLLSLMQEEGIVDDGATTETITFTQLNTGADEQLGFYAVESSPPVQGESSTNVAIIVGAIAVITVAVFAVFIAVWSMRGCDGNYICPCLGIKPRTKSRYIPKVRLPDVEEATTASGVLGANGRHPNDGHDENVPPRKGLTPRKVVHRDPDSSSIDIPLSPMSISETTNASNITDMSFSSRAPLGIRSMRKLNKYMTPEKARDNPVYDMKRLSMT